MNTTLELCFLLVFSYLLILLSLALLYALYRRRSRQCLINRLPDDALLLIFAQLPLTDLLLLSGTCRRWQLLLPAATAARRALFLLDPTSWSLSRNLGCYYPSPIEDLASERILLCEKTYAHSLVQGCVPYLLGVRLHPTKPLQPYGRYSRSLYLQPLSAHLPRLFPNIRRLYISLQGPTETLALLLELLTAWGPRLTTLHLSFTGMDQDGVSISPESSHTLFTQLQVIINSMVTLKNLHFFVTPPASSLTGGPIRFHLPIIAQLERFYCSTQYFTDSRDDDLVLTQLALTHPERSSLVEVGLLNWVRLEAPQLMAPHLAKAFVRLSLIGRIADNNLATFTLLSTQWSSLRSLTLETDLPLSRLLAALRPLNRLVDLVLYNNSRADELPQESPPVQLPSVKRLRLFHCSTTHQSLREAVQQLGRVFPGVQVAVLKSRSDRCVDCGYQRAPGDLENQQAIVPFDQNLAEGCDRASLEYLWEEGVFPNLRVIWQPNRRNWNEWDADTLLYLPV